MTLEGGPAEVELLARRVDFLTRLADRPMDKRDLVADLGHSRSTVDRAIRELTDVGFVERRDGRYSTTLSGRLAAERYRQFLAEERAVLDARPVLAALPPDCSLPMAVLSDASVETAEHDYWLFERVADLLGSAGTYTAVLPHVVDARHLRRCQARADQGRLTGSLFVAQSALERLCESFPHLALALGETDGLSVDCVETPPYGLVLAEGEAGATLLVVTYDDGAAAGVCRTDSPEAVAWARERIAAVEERATDATAHLRAVETTPGDRLAPQLRTQGFRSIDAAAAPTSDGADSADSLAVSLFERLREGERLAVLGPDEAARRAVCERVATQWFEAGVGPVFYREAGSGQPFDATGTLETTLESAPDHPLVVVEDAVGADANAVFDVMQALGGRSDVTFLLAATESEWHDPADLRVDARLAAFRREAIETVGLSTDGV